MTCARSLRFVPMLCVSLFMAACTPAIDMQGSNRTVAQRMQNRLAPDIATGQATLYAAPDHTTVIIPERALFSPSAPGLDENGKLILARVMQGFLKPEITRITVSGPPTQAWTLQADRVQAVRAFLTTFGLGSSLQPAGTPVAAPAPGFGSIAIDVQVVWS